MLFLCSAVVTSSVASLIVVSTDPSTIKENTSQLAVRGRSAVEQWRRSSLSGTRELVSAGTVTVEERCGLCDGGRVIEKWFCQGIGREWYLVDRAEMSSRDHQGN